MAHLKWLLAISFNLHRRLLIHTLAHRLRVWRLRGSRTRMLRRHPLLLNAPSMGLALMPAAVVFLPLFRIRCPPPLTADKTPVLAIFVCSQTTQHRRADRRARLLQLP
jgi:hypothetical protein